MHCLLLSLVVLVQGLEVRTCSTLTEKKCVPCEGGVSPYSEQEALAQLALLDGWKLTNTNGCFRISRSWKVKDFISALHFFRKVGTLAESEAHHPDLHLTSYRNVSIDISTHAICGLSENDFILAAKINQIPIDLKKDLASIQAQMDTKPPSMPLPDTSSRVGKVHMLCGMISSGKSTHAKRLQAATDGVIFSPDDWMLALYGASFPVERFQEHGDSVKSQIWDVAQSFLVRGIDVVLDFSLWQKAERDDWRVRAEAVGATVQLYYLKCSAEVMLQRLRDRNARVELGLEKHFLVTEATFERWIGLLEPPGPEEWPIVVDHCSSG